MSEKKKGNVLIRFKNVEKMYAKNNEKALKNIFFDVYKGEFVFLTGASGSGKTTLLKILYKDEEISSGIVYMYGKNIKNIKKQKLRRRMGIVFQDYRLLKNKTVLENVRYPLDCLGVNPFKVKKEVLKALEKLHISELQNKYPDELSGGQQQRVAIARAIINKPDVLICDEPTGNLDSENAFAIMRHLNDLHQEGTTIIMTTHNEEILMKESDKRVIVLKDGLIEKDILSADLFNGMATHKSIGELVQHTKKEKEHQILYALQTEKRGE